MVATAYTVAFEGLDARLIEVQCALTPGMPGFTMVGLPDKAVSEAKERVRAALTTLSISFPSKRITVNFSPADLPKEGSHYDLPVALALLAALDVVPPEAVAEIVALGELGLDGGLVGVNGALPAAVTAASENKTLVCPEACGAEAAWIGAATVLAAPDLFAVMQHLTGTLPLVAAAAGTLQQPAIGRDLREVKGQERGKRALEIAAAGRHHLLLIGPPGAGKSMLASCLPGLMPPLSPMEALETSMVHSLAGLIETGGISLRRPFREVHHTASGPALVGGGQKARPGEISLAHNGVLFLDELPEFDGKVLDQLRQPLETGEIYVARAAARLRYPCRMLLVAAANPCRCGFVNDANRSCNRAPFCSETYLAKISGPLLDRFDLRLEVTEMTAADMSLPPSGDTSAAVAARVAKARKIQEKRYAHMPGVRVNADASGAVLEAVAPLDSDSRALLIRAADRFGLSARGFHRILRLARTIADLDGSPDIARNHIAEALSYRIISAREGLSG